VLRTDSKDATARIAWRTSEDGGDVEYASEPERDWLQGFQATVLSSLPIDSEL
jgi:hypothetical protein